MPDTLRLTIERLGIDGHGVARRTGTTWFVPGTAPGDVVEVLAEAARPARDAPRGPRRVRILRLVRPSPDRVDPPCPHAATCGGCDWLHVAEPARRAAKRELLREALGLGADADMTVHDSPSTGFRRVARAAVGRGRAGPVIGFRSDRSRRVAALDGCSALESEPSAALGALAAAPRPLAGWLAAGGGDLWLLSDGERRVHLAEAGRSGGACPAGDPGRRGEVLAELRDRLPVGVRAPDGVLPSTEAADGGPLLRVPFGGFVQANRAAGLGLARLVAGWAGPAPGRVMELYAGSGHLTVVLARAATVLRAVEADRESAAALAWNLAARGFSRTAATRADAAVALRGLDPCPDLVVADPPRAGLGPVAGALARLRPGRVLLVSCDLRALSRDARVLAGAGYRIARTALVDLFPPTHHVEVVTEFAIGGCGAGRDESARG